MNKPHKKPMFESETRREPAANAQGRNRSPTAPPLHVSVSSPSLPTDRLGQISEPLPQTPSPSTTSHIRKGLSLLLPYILAHPDTTVSFEGARYTLARFWNHSLIYAQALSPCRWLHSHNARPPMWVTILTFCSLPFATGFSDKSVPPEREDTAPVTASALLLFLPLAILVTIVSYIAELHKTYELPAQAPVLPAPGQCSVEKTLSKAQRSLVLRSPAAAWLLLSVVIVILTGVFWRFAESPQGCNTLNPDVAGLGVRISLWVPATIVMLVAVLGHYHAEETGVKGIAATLLVAQIIYTWNLFMQELGPADKLVGSMILDCLTFLTPITFSMKECLAARQLIRIGYLFQFCSVVVLAKTMTTFHHTGLEQKLNISVESCSCFQAYWWGPFDSCVGPSETFWMYLVCKAIATIHGAWLCFRYMDHYDSAEKLSCGDSSNAKIKTIEDTVYDSIPATAFTKYREFIAIAISSMVTIEVTLLGFDLPASKDISSWGQTGQILVALATTSCFTYGFYSMWKNKNVERRQKAIRQCSYGALTPALAIHKCDDWSTWVKSLRLIVKDQHPFRFSKLRVVDHCRIQYGSEGWKKITHDCRKFKDLTREELGAMLLDEAKLGDLKTVTELIEDRASVHETDKDGNTALIIAAENNHLTIVELLLQHGALISAQNRRGETALHAAAQAKPCNEELVRILLEAGSSITIQNDRSETALHCAFQAFKDDQESHHRLAVCKLLVSKASKAAVSIVGRSGNSSLETDKSTLAIQDSSGNTPLHYAFLHLWGLVFTEAGYEVLRLFLEDSDGLIDIQNKEGMIVLHCAVEGLKELRSYKFMPNKNILAVFELLLRTTGAAVSLRDSSGSTALHAHLLNKRVWSEEWVGIMKALVETGDFSAQNNEGETVLHCAMKMIDEISEYQDQFENQWATAILLFELLSNKATQATMSLRDNSGNTPLHVYLSNEYLWWNLKQWLGVTKALVETGDFLAQNNEGKTVLHCAMKLLDDEIAEAQTDNEWADTIPLFELLLKKATPAAMSLRDKLGNTPLHAYLLNKHVWSEEWLGIMKALVETGDFSTQNNEGKTVMHCAMKMIDEIAEYELDNEWVTTIPVFEFLSKKATQAAMSLGDNSGNTPLHAYLSNEYLWWNLKQWLGVTKALVETGDFLAQNNEGKTVLHYAVEMLNEIADYEFDNEWANTIPVFELLSKKATQAAMSLRDNSGNTPLHAYLLNKHTWSEEWLGITKALVETGDLSIQNNEGKTVLHCAVEVVYDISEYKFDNESVTTIPVFELLSKKATQAAMSLRDKLGNTPLHAYLLNKHVWSEEWLGITKALVETGDFSTQNYKGKTVLHYAVERLNEIAEYELDNEWADTIPVFELLSKKATQAAMSLRDNWGDTPLHDYLFNKHTWSEEWLGIMKALVETGDFSAQNNEGKTVLHCAIDALASNIGEPVDGMLSSFLNVFRFLVWRAGATVLSIQDYLGHTPLHHAILKLGIQHINRFECVVPLLWEKTIDLGKQNNDGMTALEALLSVPATGHDERTMLDVAIADLSNETLKLLFNRSDLKPVYEQENTLLHRYLSRHADLDEEVVKILLGISDYSIKNKHGQTALHTAMANRNCPKDVLKVLLGVTRDLTLVDAWGDTFLHCYLRRSGDRDEEVANILLEAIDDLVENMLGLTLLDVAAMHADIEYGVLKVLLERFKLVSYFRVSGRSKTTATMHLMVRERDVTKLKIWGVLCQSPKEVDGYYYGEVPVPAPHGSSCTTNTRAHLHEAAVNSGDQGHLGESGIVPTTTQEHTPPFSDKPDQPMLPSISAESFETSARALLAGTRLEDIPFAGTTYLPSELDTMIDLLHCCDYRIVINHECGRLLLHTSSPTWQTTAKIIGILLDNSIDIDISDGGGQTIPQNDILSRSTELVNVLVNENRNTSRRDIDDNTFSSDTNNREKKQIGFSASPDKIISIPNRRILQPKSSRRRLNRNSNNPTSDQV